MRYRHGRRAHFGLAVHFGLVLFHDFVVIATQPLATDREACIAFAFWDARLLQQRQCSTASAQEHETRRHLTAAACGQIRDVQRPAAIGSAVYVGHFLIKANVYAVAVFQVAQ